jgi:hypothetical protein
MKTTLAIAAAAIFFALTIAPARALEILKDTDSTSNEQEGRAWSLEQKPADGIYRAHLLARKEYERCWRLWEEAKAIPRSMPREEIRRRWTAFRAARVMMRRSERNMLRRKV